MSSVACLDCGTPYAEFPLDVHLPRAQWLAIHPAEHGVLCAACIVRRAARLPGATVCHMVVEVAPAVARARTLDEVAVWLEGFEFPEARRRVVQHLQRRLTRLLAEQARRMARDAVEDGDPMPDPPEPAPGERRTSGLHYGPSLASDEDRREGER